MHTLSTWLRRCKQHSPSSARDTPFNALCVERNVQLLDSAANGSHGSLPSCSCEEDSTKQPAGKGSGAVSERVSGSYGVFFPRCTLYFSARPVRPLVPPLQSASRHEDEARFLHVKFCKLCAFRPPAPSLVQDGRLLEMQPTAIPGQIQRGSQRISWYPN